MSIVTVLVGQCGNQLGDELFSQLSRITGNGRTHPSPFFAADGRARCVLVDSEPKVVRGVQERHPDFIRGENAIAGQSGRGNNWGLGYLGVSDPHSKRYEHNVAAPRAFHNLGKTQRGQDDSVLARALCAVHRETRRTNDTDGVFDAILVLHSLVGGTGSGLGSRLVEKIRYYFAAPRDGAAAVDERAEYEMRRRDGIDGVLVEKRLARLVVSVAVAPLVAGELATQSLNATLTLRVLLRHADAVLLLRNEDVMSVPAEMSCRSRLPSSSRNANGAGGGGAGCNSDGSLRAAGQRASTYANSLLSTLTRRCTTFKEANEVFVGLLLPLLGFGLHRNTRSLLPRRSGPPAVPPNPADARNDCSMTGLLRQCCPPAASASAAAAAAALPLRESRPRATESDSVAASQLLTIVPLPQRTWERFRGAVWRSRLYRVEGAAQSMPGFAPTLPLAQILTQKAMANHEQYVRRQREDSRRGHGLHARRADTRHRRRRPGDAMSFDCISSTSEHDELDGGCSEYTDSGHADGTDHSDAETDGACGQSDRHSHRSDRRGQEFARTEGDALLDDVSGEVCVGVPGELLAYYQTLGHASVVQLYKTMEGVAVVNQVRELNASLLLPLLRSAALKLHVGAFVSTFVDAGVPMEEMEEAYRAVANALSRAEEL